MKKRVVITGLGALTPVGNSVGDMWAGICAGQSGIGPLTKFDCTAHDTKIAGEIKNFDPLRHVNKKELRRYDDFIVYALATADMVMADAGLTITDERAERAGVVIGSAIGGLATIEKEKETVLQEGPRRMSPFSAPSILANLAAGHVSIRYHLKGPIGCPVMACASGAYGIGEAFRLITGDYADVVVAGGVDSAVTSLAVGGFGAMRTLSTRNDEPAKASRPFDADRDGFVIAEGCGLMVLEELTAALGRGARIYAEIVGYGSTSDAFHMAAPPPGHEGAARCMQAALRDAGLSAGDIDYINAHGTSTDLNDLYEAQAIHAVFGEAVSRLAVSSTKSMTGHMLGGAGGVEAVISVKAIQEGILPPTINLDRVDPGITGIDLVPHQARSRPIRTAMSNSFGFGGANAVLIFKRYED